MSKKVTQKQYKEFRDALKKVKDTEELRNDFMNFCADNDIDLKVKQNGRDRHKSIETDS